MPLVSKKDEDLKWLRFDVTPKSNSQKCTCCSETLPKLVQRISFTHRGGYRGAITYTRICAKCILELAKQVDKAALKQWDDKKQQEKEKEVERAERKRIANKTF